MPLNKNQNNTNKFQMRLVWFICLMAYQHLMDYLKPKLDLFLNIGLEL